MYVTLSLTVKEEHRLRVFENRVRRRISEKKRDEETGGWTKLRNEELHNFTTRRVKWAGNVARMGGRRGMHIRCWCESQDRDR
jgi:hypothetical protein